MLSATKPAIIKLQELYLKHGNKKFLQLKVTSGGCSGFQYNFSLINPHNNLRIVSEFPNCMPVVADDDSITLVSGAKIDYVTSIVAKKFIPNVRVEIVLRLLDNIKIMVNTELLKYLDILVRDGVDIRIDAITNIIDIVSKNQVDNVVCTKYKNILCKNNEVLNYLLNRLIRGISSGRHFARIGFAICLSLSIKKWRDIISPDEILDLFFKTTDLHKHDSNREVKDYMLGRIWGSFALYQGDMLPLVSSEKIDELVERLVYVYLKKQPFTQCVSFVLFLIAKEFSKVNNIKNLEDLQTEVWLARENRVELKSNYLWEKIQSNLSKVPNSYPLVPISWFAAFEFLSNPDEFFNLWYLFSIEIFTKEQPDEVVFTAILFSPVILLLALEKPNGIHDFFKNGLNFLKYLVRPKRKLAEVSKLTLDTIISILGKKDHSNETLNSFITLSTLLGHPLTTSVDKAHGSFEIFEYIYAADSENKLYKLFLSIEQLIDFDLPINEMIKRVDFSLWFANYSRRYSFDIASQIAKQSIQLTGNNSLVYAKVLNRLLSSKRFFSLKALSLKTHSLNAHTLKESDSYKSEANFYQSEALQSCFIVSEWYNTCISDSKIMKRVSRVFMKARNHEKPDRLFAKLAMKLAMYSGSTPEIGLAHTIGSIIWNEKSIHLPKNLIYELVDPDSNLTEYFKPTEQPEEDVVVDESDITSILTQDDPFLKKLKFFTPSKWSSTHIDKRMTCLEMLKIYINSWIKAEDKSAILSEKITLDIIMTLFETFVKSFLKDPSISTNLRLFSDKLQNVIMQMAKLLKYNSPKQSRIKKCQRRIFELCNTKRIDKHSTSRIHNLGIKLMRILDEYNNDKTVEVGGINLVNKCISHRGYGRSTLLLLATNLPRVFTNFDLDKARVPTLAGLALEAATKASKNRNVDKSDFKNQLNNVIEYLKTKYVTSVPNCIDKNLRKFSNSVNPDSNMLKGANVRFHPSIEIATSS